MGARVSIVITSYNYAAFLRAAIDSALNQTYKDVEVIVVDDGSTDASPEIIGSYGTRVVPRLRANGGEAAALNLGVAAARGEIVLTLDSDDYLYPDAVARVVAAWRPGVAKVQFYLDAVDTHGRPLGHRLPNLPMGAAVMPLLRCYGYYPSPPTSGNAYARTVLDRILPLDETAWRRGPDGLLNALSAFHGEIVSLDAALGAYRIHGHNMYAAPLDLARLRHALRNELDREAAIKAEAARQGRPITRALSLSIPAHCKARLISLRLDPATHPARGDNALRLALLGIRSAWVFPHLSLRKRLLASLGFPLLAAFPRGFLARALDPLFRTSERRRLRRFLVRAAAAVQTRP